MHVASLGILYNKQNSKYSMIIESKNNKMKNEINKVLIIGGLIMLILTPTPFYYQIREFSHYN
jgi:hypothetical protein